MYRFFLFLVYLLFFLSGAAALIYEVVWVRSLSLIFGGTHLAVTTVLSVFMGGLAVGSYWIGKKIDRLKKPLQFYGLLELGIALSAVCFIGLMKVYPVIYVFLAGSEEHSKFYLTAVRVFFAFLALIVPTTLMGGTLPVLTRFVSRQSKKFGTQLSLLYGINTFGAVAGTAAAAFFLLRFYSVSTAFATAITINIVVGLVSIAFEKQVAVSLKMIDTGTAEAVSEEAPLEFSPSREFHGFLSPYTLILVGIGVSGFCALGYEVLWTRILTLTIGTSVYGFSIMLIAFLFGIALGSESYGTVNRLFFSRTGETASLIRGFGAVQCIIGLTALLVTFYIRDLPTRSVQLSGFFLDRGFDIFHARQWANLALAFSYMIVPSFFMGLAFPIAGRVAMAYEKRVGRAVGGILAYNTLGAILGSAVSGFALIYLFGIERSLQLLTVINVGFGLLIMVSLWNRSILNLAVSGLTVVVLVVLIASPDLFRMWDARYFAIFQNNQPETYSTPGKKRDAIENTEVLFYHEGVDSTISSIKIKGGNQAVLVNGKVVASASLKDRQCQMTLGHLPMLLHKNPARVLVVGLGTGMTLGAVSVHPEVEALTLAEIEPNVVGAARTFSQYNNHVLDNPGLKIVFNDGRNFLMITDKKYDVITADPIHPWTQGSGYLYTAEYFKLASEHLAPGGIMCQWLPIYELSVPDLQSVVKTFSQNFPYVMTWMTQYDAEIIGSNSPILIDEEDLERRLSVPAVNKDLKPVMMASAEDFLSYFVMGTKGMKEFSRDAIVNTDDNLYLEFSTPISLGKNVMGVNVSVIARHRESILPYLVPLENEAADQLHQAKWTVNLKAAMIADRAHALLLDGRYDDPELLGLMSILDREYPHFSPGRFVRMEHDTVKLRVPTLLDRVSLTFLDAVGNRKIIEISAVVARVSRERAAVMFTDNAVRKMFGQRYFSGIDLDERMGGFAREVLAKIEKIHQEETRLAQERGMLFPAENPVMEKIAASIRNDCSAGED